MRHVLLPLLFALLSFPAIAQEIGGTPYVIDADTLAFGDIRVRLEGIDAPESEQSCFKNDQAIACGQIATQFVRDTIGSSSVQCRASSQDRYGRYLATCFVNGENLNAHIVSNGMALVYRQYSSSYIAEEETAKANQTGIWATQFQAPWEWRRAN